MARTSPRTVTLFHLRASVSFPVGREASITSLPLTLQREAAASHSLRTGLAFATTVVLYCSLCTLVWLAAPEPFMSFMNSLFHGIDFTPLLKTPGSSWYGFVSAVVVMFIWAFLAGTFFAWLRQRLG